VNPAQCLAAALFLSLMLAFAGSVTGVVLHQRDKLRAARPLPHRSEAPVYVPPRSRPMPMPRQPVVKHWCPECDCTDHTVMVWTTFNRYICRECMDNGGYAHAGSPVAKREDMLAD
jgi:hypothetical protein